MNAADVIFLGLTEQADLVRRKELSPVELCQAYLQRLGEVDGALNCYVTLTEEAALAAARQAEAEIAGGKYRGVLHGIPIGIKDNIATAGVRTTCGVKPLESWAPRYDATVVERLREAGVVALGKLNMHEWARGSTTINPHYGTTGNPWNVGYTVGGSSGGSGAAVAAGLCTAALGTDSRGSVRHPAAACGIVGLKPTFGRVSQYGEVCSGGSTNQIGPMARRVEDVAALLGALAGHDSKDASSAHVPIGDYRSGIGAGLAGLRAGIPKEPWAPQVSREVEAAFGKAVEVLQELGMAVEEVSLPHGAADCVWNVATAAGADGASYTFSILNHMGASIEQFSSDARLAMLIGKLVPASVQVDAQRARRAIIREFDEALRRVDVILTPTRPVAGQSLDDARRGVLSIDGQTSQAWSLDLAFTSPYNLTGMPAISIPCGFSAEGLPIGLQIAGRPFEEATVLQAASAYEAATAWHKRRPQV